MFLDSQTKKWENINIAIPARLSFSLVACLQNGLACYYTLDGISMGSPWIPSVYVWFCIIRRFTIRAKIDCKMGTFDVLRCAFTARTRVAKALSFPVKRRPFCTKNVAPGILLYHPGRLKPLTDTFSGCAEAAKTPERLIEWFHEIKTQHDLFEVK